MNWANALIPTLSRPKPRGTWPALREWEDIRLPIPKVSLHKLKQYKTLSINIFSNNTNLFKQQITLLIHPKNQTQVMQINVNHPSINFQLRKAYLNMLIHIILLLRCLQIMQYQISWHSIAREKWLRRNVGEVTSNSRDPGKIVEGSQTSLSKLINEMHGFKTFENILLSKYSVYSI